MSGTIGFERDDQPGNETNDVDEFVALYDEINNCRSCARMQFATT